MPDLLELLPASWLAGGLGVGGDLDCTSEIVTPLGEQFAPREEVISGGGPVTSLSMLNQVGVNRELQLEVVLQFGLTPISTGKLEIDDGVSLLARMPEQIDLAAHLPTWERSRGHGNVGFNSFDARLAQVPQ